jgi:hypothetical protein
MAHRLVFGQPDDLILKMTPSRRIVDTWVPFPWHHEGKSCNLKSSAAAKIQNGCLRRSSYMILRILFCFRSPVPSKGEKSNHFVSERRKTNALLLFHRSTTCLFSQLIPIISFLQSSKLKAQSSKLKV